MLKDLSFKPTYFKSRNELLDDFYKPCMANSIKYDRITGYFGSSVFLVLNDALKEFLNNRGHIRIICSPELSDDDLLAIKNGYDKKTEISDKLNEILDELSNDYPSSTFLLSKLVESGYLDIRLAVFKGNLNAARLFHDKAGVFIDELNNAVSFRGSLNETFQGISEYGNSESFDVFTNWEEKKDSERVKLVISQFNNIWENKEPNTTTIKIPDVSLEKIKSFKTDKSIDDLLSETTYELNEIKLRSKWHAETGYGKRIIRKHQENILDNWEKNNRKGIFSMCTGAGKTFTALCAIRESIFEKKEIPLIIVPSKILFQQWESELIKTFSNEISILRIGNGNPLNAKQLKLFSNEDIDEPRCILATYQSANKDSFINAVHWGKHIFLVCDEVHNIGSQQNSKLIEIDVGPRIGLSATPKRYFDDEGTDKIMSFFGGIIDPEYKISDAIKDDVLCEYFYEINEVKLSEEEQKNWNNLTKKINRIGAINNFQEIDEEKLKLLLFKRADIVKTAEEKVFVAEKILIENYKPGQKWLVYLDNVEQTKKLKSLLDEHNNLKNAVFEYHTKADNSLEETLKYFSEWGGILLSINCLDEGVDIPSITHAIILASSKNYKQYIQRRGRVLRKSRGKNFAYIYDCFVSPNSLVVDEKKGLSIISSELKRSVDFAKDATNADTISNKIRVIMSNNNICFDNKGE